MDGEACEVETSLTCILAVYHAGIPSSGNPGGLGHMQQKQGPGSGLGNGGLGFWLLERLRLCTPEMCTLSWVILHFPPHVHLKKPAGSADGIVIMQLDSHVSAHGSSLELGGL